jgi:hypothetical protein
MRKLVVKQDRPDCKARKKQSFKFRSIEYLQAVFLSLLAALKAYNISNGIGAQFSQICFMRSIRS